MHPAVGRVRGRGLRGDGGNGGFDRRRWRRSFRNGRCLLDGFSGCWWSFVRLGCGRLLFDCRGDRRLDDACRRSDNNHRARSGNCGSGLGHGGAGWRFGNNCACRRAAGNGRRSGRWGDDRRRLARLRNDLARLRTHRRRGGSRWRGGNRGSGRLGRRLRPGRHADVTSLLLLFLLLGQDSLHHIAGLGDVRQIDLGNDAGRAVAGRRGIRCRPRIRRKMRANLFRLVAFERAGVRFARRHTEFRKNVENRARLNFQLFREIVDTNLAHPPLFNSVPPQGR